MRYRKKSNTKWYLLLGLFLLIGAKFSSKVKDAVKNVPLVGNAVSDPKNGGSNVSNQVDPKTRK